MVPHISFLLVSANDSSKRDDSEVNIVKMCDTGGDDTPLGKLLLCISRVPRRPRSAPLWHWMVPAKKKHTKKYRSLPLPISKSIIINLHINTSWIFPINISKNPSIMISDEWNSATPSPTFAEFHPSPPLRLVGPSARNNFCSLVWVDPVDPNIPKGRPQAAMQPTACE